MIVEDEEITAMAIEMSLQKMGYDVVATSNSGEDAIRQANASHPDLVLMDIKLKGVMSGIEAAEEIRRTLGAPVIYLTAYSDDETLKKAKVADPFGYVLKPYQDQELHAAVVIGLHNASLERNRAAVETALRAREELLNDVLENSPAAVWLKDLDGHYLFANKEFASFDERSSEGLTQRDEDVLHRGVAGEEQETIARGGEERTYLTIRFPLTARNGATYGIGGVMTDITALKKTREELERRLAEQARELAAVNQQMTSFTRSVTHQLRDPAQRLSELSEALGGATAAGESLVERIRTESERMMGLLNELMSAARAPNAEPQFHRIDLSAMAREVVTGLRSAEPDRERLSVEIADGLSAWGDPFLLRLALEHLLANAWRFTIPKESPRIEFGATASAAGIVTYSVRDNGVGLDATRTSELFQPFARLRAHPELEGAGLGLSCVRRIIERHRGRIWVEGRPGEGATFLFTLGSAPE